MGVPGFYRWSVRRVPHVRQKTSQPPYEFDCLYLDFNGVIHGSIEEWGGQHREDVLFQLIVREILLVVMLARPRLLLYIAIDGVAPRAKMNQQRSRRFRAAKDREETAGTVEGVCQHFDRNAVTPGTDFMSRLSDSLQAWAATSAESSALRGVTIVISDDRDPGEGEHKIMEVIRRQPDHTHCLVSSDADLVFLGLVSPAEHVYLLRANQHRDRSQGLQPSASSVSDSASPSPHGGGDGGGEGAAAGDAAEGGGDGDSGGRRQEQEVRPHVPGATDYELLSIGAVRKYLASELPGCDEKRLAMDFVAMCCLAGNDFLPHIPAVDIYQGGVDRLLTAYKKLAPAEQGYLVSEDGALELPRWRALLAQFAPVEAEALLDSVGLGLGAKMPPYRGPKPPDDTWDGLSVLVSWAPAQASAEDVIAGMSKQACNASSAHLVRRGNATKGTSSWLVRFADPASAVKTLTSIRRVWGNKVGVVWVDPSTVELPEPPEEPFERAEWRPHLGATVRECFEYWFGPDNLPRDAFLRRHVRQREDRFVPVRVVAKFPRMLTLLQDVGEIAEILRASDRLEVQGSGQDAFVRGVEDHSVRPEESPEEVARQQKAAAAFAAGDHVTAALTLREDYYRRHGGPVAAGSPDPDDLAAVERHRSRAFLQGVEWVVRYYVRGCSSWSWFYPAHYPPLCVSLLEQTNEPLEAPPLHAPFPPELQLMAVLPPQSAVLLPEPIRRLLQDPMSPVADFYPQFFEVDLKEGDREWQGIALLPFVDESRLRTALREVASEAADASSEPFRAPHACHAPAPQQLPEGGDDGASDGAGGAAAAAGAVLVTTWAFDASKSLPEGRPSMRSTHSRPEEAPPPEVGGGGGADAPQKGAGRSKGRGKRKS